MKDAVSSTVQELREALKVKKNLNAEAAEARRQISHCWRCLNFWRKELKSIEKEIRYEKEISDEKK